MKSYRCLICGEVTISRKTPSECPFCGVSDSYMKEASEVDGSEIFKVKTLSEDSRKNLISALNLEVSNASFYKCASEKSESETMRAIFKRLANIEREHADTIRKYLELDSIEFIEEECSEIDKMNLEEASTREESALNFYKNAAIEAKEPKISMFFRAISEVEEGHLKILRNLEN